MKPSVLVVGGSGFIGSHVMARHPEWTNWDLKDGINFKDGASDFDVIIVLAAWLGMNDPDHFAKNLDIYQGIVKSVQNSLEPPLVVFASSAAVYGPLAVPAQEDDPLTPTTLYGKSKVIGEQIVRAMCDQYVILRFANVWGYGGHGAIDLFANGVKTIHGIGDQVRDYIHVSGIVNVIDRIVAEPDQYSGVYNIGSGFGQTTKMIFDVHGSGTPEYAPSRPEDVAYSVLDNTKAVEAGLL